MCEFCEDGKTLLKEIDLISKSSWGWGNDEVEVKLKNTCTFELRVFIDRGYLRLVDPDDCGCLDHGQKVLINYCPMCGKRIIY